MPTANVLEMESCLNDCIRFCDEHPDLEIVQLFRERIVKTQRKWRKSVRESDSEHRDWRAEQKEGRVVQKERAMALREVQRELRRIGALDFPSQRVLYWDEDALDAVISEMITYLREHRDDLDFASDYLDTFERLRKMVAEEEKEEGMALKNFQRSIDMRREAMGEMASMISEFRGALRRQLGKKHPDYLSINWPHAINSDEGVLF